MSLMLSVVTYRNQPPSRAISATFKGGGGTIGRLDQNALVLPDPERIISRTHARVDFRGGCYYITALGQNPIDLNGRALSAGEPAKLSSGDKLTIGDYGLVVNLEGEETDSGLADILTRPARLAEPLDSGLVEEPESQVAFGIRLTGGASPPSERGPEPAGPPPVSTRGHQQRDQVPGFLEPLTPVRPVSHIPDDFDLLRGLDGKTASPAEAPAPPPTAPILPEDPFAETVPLEDRRTPRTEAALPSSKPQAPAIPATAPPARAAAAPASEPGAAAAGDYARAVRVFLEAAGACEWGDQPHARRVEQRGVLVFRIGIGRHRVARPARVCRIAGRGCAGPTHVLVDVGFGQSDALLVELSRAAYRGQLCRSAGRELGPLRLD